MVKPKPDAQTGQRQKQEVPQHLFLIKGDTRDQIFPSLDPSEAHLPVLASWKLNHG